MSNLNTVLAEYTILILTRLNKLIRAQQTDELWGVSKKSFCVNGKENLGLNDFLVAHLLLLSKKDGDCNKFTYWP